MAKNYAEIKEHVNPGIKIIHNNEELEEVAIKLTNLRSLQQKGEDVLDEIKKCNESILTYDKFSNYVYKYVLNTYPTYAAAHPNAKEEMMSLVWEELFLHIHQYRLTKGDVTTFCKPHVKHGCALYISELNNQTRYYNDQNTKISQVEKEYLAEGYDESEITDVMISEKLPGISIKQINEARKRNELSKYSTLDTDYEAPSFATPEKELMQRETSDKIVEILNNLQPYHRIVLMEATANKNWIENLSHDADFISMIKKAGYNQYISCNDEGIKSIKPIKLKLLYQEAIEEARYFSGKKPEPKAGKGSYIEFNSPSETNKNIDELLLTI